MCKVCGFADHSKSEGFCTHCHIPHADLKTEQAMMYDESDKAREEFFKTNSTQWFELARLKYFDPVRMMIIDPMHNILLGIVRTQWFDSWIKTNTLRKRTKTLGVPRELDQIHTYLDAFEMPPWEARLPEQVGYPAGGSLTSDEWKGLALVFCPIIIPLIWEEWSPKNQEQNKKDLQNWDKREKARLNQIAKGKGTKKDAEPSAKPVERMHPDDAKNFLHLTAALKLILGRSIHNDNVKPNHHYLTHIFDQLHDYGPVYGFWTFLFKRLNKVLKSYTTNNHGNGKIEVTFFHAFMRDISLRTLVCCTRIHPSN
ncbi:uncharacterized protein EDB91DRAFT_1240882 [Suillus paluster]|uniref:uncharacterized protein n=1 Tax=Suillus paluster TaxID=48578 RepID=UPI001B8858A3|nr:uncharacterized protein EDB91DRAFT_1240882 [Suillus paluster]KAG1718381.1 hypothetical protein EDB91DRAFT_1240882 [Suillus paluster]